MFRNAREDCNVHLSLGSFVARRMKVEIGKITPEGSKSLMPGRSLSI